VRTIRGNPNQQMPPNLPAGFPGDRPPPPFGAEDRPPPPLFR
jgi:hypothetical protein